MKTISILLALCLFASCREKITLAADITVIDDRTDSLKLHPLADPILSIYDFENDQDKSAHFKLSLITDKLLNPVVTMNVDNSEVAEQQNIQDYVDYREQCIHAFYDDIRRTITEFPKRFPAESLSKSQCFATVACELELLAQSYSRQKTLIVFSNLMENTDVFSCYSQEGRVMLKDHPEKVIQILCKNRSLPGNLRGIVVYLVFEPQTILEDKSFGAMAGIYKKLLEQRGARVIIQANNNSFSI